MALAQTAPSSTTGKRQLRMNIQIPATPRFDTSADFLELPYNELERRNVALKREREAGHSDEYFAEKLKAELQKEISVKAVTVGFSDVEGKLQMLDYNKAFLLESHDNLTFDGSSIHGFTKQNQSDLRLKLDWSTFRWLPADVFGAGKVLIFADVYGRDGMPYEGDYRCNLKLLRDKMKAKHDATVNVAAEIEGFVFEGENAEQNYDERIGFKLVTKGGYFHALPQDQLRQFIDRLAEATRAMGFENEKDHPEVAPSSFEMNYRYTEVLHAADQVQLYKVAARQIAKNFGFTACFLPKPVPGINGSGMHTNLSISEKGKNIFYDATGENGLSEKAHHFILGVLAHGKDICLAINPSVNAYRRLDPKYEAPNQIKVSAIDRGAMIRIPLANENSARIEIRSVAPDANPYFAWYMVLKAGLKGMLADDKTVTAYKKAYTGKPKKLPGNIYDAIAEFKKSAFIKEVLTPENRQKYLELKEAVAHRSPLELGSRVKNSEVWYHHEVSNQVLWSEF
ncbi:MAG: glutamine synthetase family protein [Candidatus Peregrinibacteria bacterium]